MKSTKSLVTDQIEMMASLQILKSSDGKPKHLSLNKMKAQLKNPCDNAWERKWLELDVVHPDVQRMATAAQGFAGRWFHKNHNQSLLVLSGESGTGKTHTLRKLVTYARAMGLGPCEYGYWPSPPSILSVDWSSVLGGFKEGRYGLLADMQEVDLLAIDDIGAEHDPSGFGTGKLCEILSRRERKFTVITTNITPGLWATRFDVRVSDRLLRNSAVLNLKAPSFALRGMVDLEVVSAD